MSHGIRIRLSSFLRGWSLVLAVAAVALLAGRTLPSSVAQALTAGGTGQPTHESAVQSGQIERFDVKKGQVVDRIAVTEEIGKELRTLAQSASVSAGTIRIDPADGTVLHFPLQPAVEIRQPGFFALAAEAYVFLPIGREPYILFFSEENEPRLFGLKHPVKALLALCGWEDAYAAGH